MAEYRSTLILDCDIQMTNRVELGKEKKKTCLEMVNRNSKSIDKNKKNKLIRSAEKSSTITI